MTVASSRHTRAVINTRELALHLGASCVLASGIASVASRWAGVELNVQFLTDTQPSQAWYLIATVGLLPIIATTTRSRSRYAFVYLLAMAFVASIVAVHLTLSPPASHDAWNTPLFELLRFISLHTILAIPFCLIGAELKENRVIARASIRALRLLLWTGVCLTLVAALQAIDAAPHFFYQWYGGVRLPRPTGGLEHPHFFAVVMMLCCCSVYWLRDRGEIGPGKKSVLVGVYVAGVVISTSRIGLAVTVLAVAFLEFNAQNNTVRRRLIKGAAGVSVLALAVLLGVAFIDRVQASDIWLQIEAFLSAFNDSFSSGAGSGEFLRGRGSRWAHEFDLITVDAMHLLFGYGYQPFVSHNLVLRQLQVSGIVGTTAYLAMLGAFAVYVYSQTARSDRAYLVAPAIALSVASLTFPVLVSILVMSAVAVLVVAIGNNSAVRRCH